MTDDELRGLVRDAVAKHLGGAPIPMLPSAEGPAAGARQHASHDIYHSLVNVGEACLIEPSVECTHCNYCKSHGH